MGQTLKIPTLFLERTSSRLNLSQQFVQKNQVQYICCMRLLCESRYDVYNSFGNLPSMWTPESEFETEPTEPGPLGEKTSEKKKSIISCLCREMIFPVICAVQIAERSSIPALDSTLFTSHASSAWTASASTGEAWHVFILITSLWKPITHPSRKVLKQLLLHLIKIKSPHSLCHILGNPSLQAVQGFWSILRDAQMR